MTIKRNVLAFETPKELREDVKEYADRNMISMSDVLRIATKTYITENKSAEDYTTYSSSSA
jgi:metal-responsive CopG/Arc/MetJ family transcriptional regulator